MSSLQLDSLSFSYGTSKILSGIFLKIQTADIFCLLGRNGCGKSTFFKCILNLLPNPGTLFMDGHYLAKTQIWKYAGYLPQVSFLPRHEKVRRIIHLFLPKDTQRQLLLNEKRLAALLDKHVKDLSGGERKYLSTLLLLAGDKPFLLLDEPFSEVEPKYIELLFEKIAEKKKTTGLIITDHDHWAVRKIASRLAVLADGCIREIMNTDEELKKYGYLHSG